MNANELADELEETIKEIGRPFTTTALEAAKMLRQQQAEIEELKADNARLKQFCWESDEAKQFLSDIRKAQEK